MPVGIRVALGVRVGVRVRDGLMVGVTLGSLVKVSEGVEVGVEKAVGLCVGVAETGGVAVGVTLGGGVRVTVGVAEGVGVHTGSNVPKMSCSTGKKSASVRTRARNGSASAHWATWVPSVETIMAAVRSGAEPCPSQLASATRRGVGVGVRVRVGVTVRVGVAVAVTVRDDVGTGVTARALRAAATLNSNTRMTRS